MKEVAGLLENVEGELCNISQVNPPWTLHASHDCWQTFTFFFHLLWFLNKRQREREEKGETDQEARKHRPALSFLLNTGKKNRQAEEKTQRSSCSRVQMHSISCGWKSLGFRPVLSVRRGGGEHSLPSDSTATLLTTQTHKYTPTPTHRHTQVTTSVLGPVME